MTESQLKRSSIGQTGSNQHQKIIMIVNAGEDAVKLDHSYMAGGNVKWYSHSGKQFGSFLKMKQATVI